MPLEPQRTSFPIIGGQEQGVAPELIDPPGITVAHNIDCRRPGELTKRFGWLTSDDNSSILPQPDRLMTRDNEILWIGESRSYQATQQLRTNSKIFSRAVGETEDVSGGSAWQARGEIPRFNIQTLREFTTRVANARISKIDCAFAGSVGDLELRKGVVCCMWRYADSTRVDYAIVDVATESILATGVVTYTCGTYAQIRCVALLHVDRWYFHLYWGAEGGWPDPIYGFDRGDVKFRTIAAHAPFTLGSEQDALFVVNGFDVAVTLDSAKASETGTFEPRLFLLYTRSDTNYAYCLMFLPGSGGTLSQAATAYSNVGPQGAGAAAHAHTLHATCDPNGRHIAATWNQGGDTGGQEQSDRIAQFGATDASTRVLTAEAQGPLGVDADSSGQNRLESGLQVGWAGYDGNGNRQFWKVTWGGTISRTTPWGMYCAEVHGNSGTTANMLFDSLHMQWCPWSRIWTYRGESYCLTTRGGQYDQVMLEIVSLPISYQEVAQSPRVQGRIAQGRIAGTVSIAGTATHNRYWSDRGRNSVVASTIDEGRFFAAVPVVSQNGLYHNIALLDIRADDPQQYDWCEYGGQTWIACGVPWCYDGRDGHEIGFPHRPQLYYNVPVSPAVDPGTIFATNVSATPSMTEGAYLVAMTWESTDAAGRRSESSAAYANEGAAITVGAGETIRVLFTPLGVTSRMKTSSHIDENVAAVIYVSNDGGLNYYRYLGTVPYWLEGSDRTLSIDLDPTYLFVAGAPKLESLTGILERDTLPAMRFCCAWQNRLWFANDTEVWYSCEIIDGEEPRFNRALSFKIPTRCSGIVGMDDRLIIFGTRPDAVYWISGDGPTDTGEGGSFTMPQLVATGQTCIDARSICQTPKGIIYRSRRGIELLQPDMTVRYIGGGIERHIRETGWTEIISAQLDPEFQVVTMVARVHGSISLCSIVKWHVNWELWTTADVPVVSNTLFRTDAVIGTVRAANQNWMGFGDRQSYYYAPQCTIARESRSVKFDGRDQDGSRHGYNCTVETADIKLDGLRGFQRVWRAYCLIKDRGEGSRATGFAMGYANDFSTNPTDIFTSQTAGARRWTTEDEMSAGATASSRHWEYGIHIDKQQSSAIRLRFASAYQTGVATVPVDTDLTFVGFGIEWGREPGTGKQHWRSKK